MKIFEIPAGGWMRVPPYGMMQRMPKQAFLQISGTHLPQGQVAMVTPWFNKNWQWAILDGNQEIDDERVHEPGCMWAWMN